MMNICNLNILQKIDTLIIQTLPYIEVKERLHLERREVEKRIYGVKGYGSRLPLPFMVIA